MLEVIVIVATILGAIFRAINFIHGLLFLLIVQLHFLIMSTFLIFLFIIKCKNFFLNNYFLLYVLLNPNVKQYNQLKINYLDLFFHFLFQLIKIKK